MLFSFFFFFLFLFFSNNTHLSLCVNQEGLHLQIVKLSLDDPDGVLASWNEQDETPCSWFGVLCDNTTLSVTGLDLDNSNIGGPFPLEICNLPNLAYISFFNNNINSTIPCNISDCANLQHLDLGQNYLTGPIPRTLGDIRNLRYLDLSGNSFSGTIPRNFGEFENLEALSLVNNFMEGPIPSFLGNITSLKMLNLSYNSFTPGKFPPELGNLTNLEVLWMAGCFLTGNIPDSLGRLKRLHLLDLTNNQLTGPLPASFVGLTSVVQIELYNNSLSGDLPSGFSNLTSLTWFDVSMNRLTGTIPEDLCQLPLKGLHVYENKFHGTVPEILGESEFLKELGLFNNNFSGTLPQNLGAKSPLVALDVSYNKFTGEIPPNLCAKGHLKLLMLIHNEFTGGIPESFGECYSLTRFRLGNNKLSGQVPEKIWGLPHVNLLDLVNNSFTGHISSKIGEAQNISMLVLSNNHFSGQIPEEIGVLNNLVEFSAANNRFTGRFPMSVGTLSLLGSLNLENNKLSGVLPDSLAWDRLNELNLANNSFSGQIPEALGHLQVLNYIDLSRNRLTGCIPLKLQNLKLNLLNLSYNHLSGRIPSAFKNEMFKDSFLGNPGLIKKDYDVHLRKRKAEAETNIDTWVFRSILILAALVSIVGVCWFQSKYRKLMKIKSANEKLKWTIMPFHKLSISEEDILKSLNDENVIGSGASGQVYKVVLRNGEIVAVKKLWGGEKDRESIDFEEDWILKNGFDAEVKTLGKIRHKNIVKLLCCCTNRDSKLLVYEYMQNGSLGDLLHSSEGGILDWPARFKIALGAAEGLSYLHHDCVPPIVHRDVKSNNILLDDDFGAIVADFGVAKAVDFTDMEAEPMSVVAGSWGYIAPEYAYTVKVNEKSDIYSFGVVILELITGKRPIDPEFGEVDLFKWASSTLYEKGIEQVVDKKLDLYHKEEISKVLDIALLCTSPLPINRPSMRRVVKLLQELGANNHIKAVKKDEHLTPYYFEDASYHGSLA